MVVGEARLSWLAYRPGMVPGMAPADRLLVRVNVLEWAMRRAGGREQQVGTGGGRCALVIKHQQDLGGLQGSVHLGRVGTAIQIVFQYHHGIGLAID